MDHAKRLELIAHLSQFISGERMRRFDEVLANRTAHMRVVLEDIYQEHNASAVLRSCDCFGVQHVHFIEGRNSMRVNDEVAMGSSQWLTIHRHRASEDAATVLQDLKTLGYRVVAVTPHAQGFVPKELPVDSPFALVFGTEKAGISQTVSALADQYVRLPMYGFTESFNVSVCAALCMYELAARLRSGGREIGLPDEEKSEVLLSWLKKSIDASDAIVRRFLGDEKV